MIKVFWYCEKWQPGGIQRVQVNLLPYFDPKEIQFDLAFSEDDTALFDEKIQAAGARKLVTLDRRYGSPGKRTLANFFAVRRILRRCPLQRLPWGGTDVSLLGLVLPRSHPHHPCTE